MGDSGVVHDVSIYGFFIMTSKHYPEGSVLKIQILTPNSKHINLEGVVQWSVRKRDDVKWLIKDSGMGIKIKRFQCGQEHYEKICQQLCQRNVLRDRDSEKTKSSNFFTRNNGIFGRFFR
jgi:hypothetical protein